MRYFAKDLRSVYEILETLPKPLAILDFMCGEVGREVGIAQGVGGQFYDDHQGNAHVVALCWDGASILYSNVSDDQIEFTDKAKSRAGDKRHDGGRKIHWLEKRGHGDRLAAMAGVVARCGPLDVSEKAIARRYGLYASASWKMAAERLTHTGYIFATGNQSPIQEPYVILFDRNDRHQPERNTRSWQVVLLRQWAQELGLRLAIVSDFYPRQWSGNVIRFSFRDRNIDLLCDLARHSILYAAPSSGAGDAACVFGCNFVALSSCPESSKDTMASLVTGRGFRHFGTLVEPDSEVASNVREYLESQR